MGASLHSWRKNVLHLSQGRINELWEECEQPSKLRKGKECEQPSKSRKGKEWSLKPHCCRRQAIEGHSRSRNRADRGTAPNVEWIDEYLSHNEAEMEI